MNKIFTKAFYTVAVIAFFLGVALPAGAQMLFSNTPVETGGLYSALAKDASNNIYVIRVKSGSGGTLGEVVKYTGSTPAVIYSGLHEGDDTGAGGDLPWGLAVTSTGNVYISTDFAAYSGAIIKLTLSGGTYTASNFQTGKYYTALAIDAADNLYATQFDGATHYAVYKYAANSAAGNAGTKIYGNLKQGAGYSYPTGLAVAPNGDIFVTDPFAQDPSLPANGGHIFKLTKTSGYTASVFTTNHYATALAFDPAGNLYTAEYTTPSPTGYKLLKYANAAGAPQLAFQPMHSNGIYAPFGIAAISAAEVYAIDGDDGTTGSSLNHLAPSTNATLASLIFTPNIAKTVTTGPGYANYKASVPNTTTSVNLTAVTRDSTATLKINGQAVKSGVASQALQLNVGDNVITTAVTAQDGTTVKNYIITLTRAPLPNTYLASVTFNPNIAKTVVDGPGFANYTATVKNSVSSIMITPVVQDPTSTIRINNAAVASGGTKTVNLVVGDNTITILVTGSDHVTNRTYIYTITRQPPPNTYLASITFNPNIAKTVVDGPGYANYTATVKSSVSSIMVTPVVQDPTSTIRINNAAVASGDTKTVNLAVGDNTITVLVTGNDHVTNRTYIYTITRQATPNTYLASLNYSPNFVKWKIDGPGYANWDAQVPVSFTQVSVTPVTEDPLATVTVNNMNVKSGETSSPIGLGAGINNVITTVVTGSDGVTTRTYILNLGVDDQIDDDDFFVKYNEKPDPIANTSITVRQGLSPNGDGKGDVLVIDGIAAHPNNTLQIMSRSGELVYQVKGYDNTTKAFDGRSNINGKLQVSGTYFYSLDYKDGAETKRKTGFIVLKY